MTRLRPLAALLGLAAVLALVAVLGRYEVIGVGPQTVARLDRWTGQTLLVDAPGGIDDAAAPDRSALSDAAIDAAVALVDPCEFGALSRADVRKLLDQ